MTMQDPFSANNLRLPDEMIPDEALEARRLTPKNVIKRRDQFVQFPMWWLDSLGTPKSAWVLPLAIHLLHLDWRNKHQPFKLPNGFLEECGISRFSKYRGLAAMERHGLISVEYRERKSPVVRVISNLKTREDIIRE